MKDNHLKITKTARYYTLGKLDAGTEEILFALHGYGQLASDFIKKFESINTGNRFVIAPEALNKFYLKGFNGKVGASWMTKEERENEILDYVNYLDEVYRVVLKGINTDKLNIRLLGFSQGCATACRWFAYGETRIDELILWGGSVPPDSDFTLLRKKLKGSINLVIGSDDQFISDDILQQELSRLNRHGINYEINKYSGQHDILPEYLNETKMFR